MTTTFAILRVGCLAVAGATLSLFLALAPANGQCVGDCDGMGTVQINELITGVNIALGSAEISACPSFDCLNTGTVPIPCLIRGVNNALDGCPTEVTPTSTEAMATPTGTAGATATATDGVLPTPTNTPGPACPIAEGAYTVTQLAGGELSVYSFQPFPFPAGGFIVQDVSAASLPDCVHDVVVPFPDGFSAPTFCVPALGLSVIVAQTGCGIGKIDSNGGSDFTINELGDTSDSSSTCNLPQGGTCTQGADASIRVDVTVGNDEVDTCASGGTANAIVTIPVHTTSWAETGGMPNCGTGTPDVEPITAEFDQILDFTTDTASGRFMDLDGDGCLAAGPIPGGPFTGTGVCLHIVAGTVTTVASGQFGSTGGTFDGAFITTLPNTISGPEAPLGATCASPPLINYSGLATRCIAEE